MKTNREKGTFAYPRSTRLARTLQALRIGQQMSQIEMSNGLGIAQSQLSQWESPAPTSLESYERMAGFLGYDIEIRLVPRDVNLRAIAVE